MLKWILITGLVYTLVGYVFAVNSSYVPISKQIDVKTMSLTNPSYIVTKDSPCSGTCKNYTTTTTTSSWGGGSYGGK